MRHTVITTSRWTEWWNVIANKESIQINEHILAKKNPKNKKTQNQMFSAVVVTFLSFIISSCVILMAFQL